LYSNFLATHPLVFADATDPLEPDSWSTPQSLSLGYFTVQSIKRLYTLCSSSEAQLERGGHPTSPPYLMITMFHGVNSVLPFMHITYLWVCSTASRRSSWTLSKGTTMYATTRGSSTPWLNMAHTTSTRMKRRRTCTMQGSPSICRSAWYISPACHTMS
jgi:hypothetical protein